MFKKGALIELARTWPSSAKKSGPANERYYVGKISDNTILLEKAIDATVSYKEQMGEWRIEAADCGAATYQTVTARVLWKWFMI